MPVVAAALFRSRGFSGPSLSQASVKRQLLDLWEAKRCNAWRAALGRVLTTVARMVPSSTRTSLLWMLRSCGRSYRSNTQISWKPHVVLCLGMCAVPLGELEHLMGRSFRRFCPQLAALATKVMDVPAPEAEPMSNEERGSSSSSSSDSGSETSSSDGDGPCMSDDAQSPCSSRAGDVPAGTPAAPASSSAGQAVGQAGPTLVALVAPLRNDNSSGAGEGLAKKQAGGVARVLRLRKAAPRRVLGLAPRGSVAQSEIRKSYLRLAALIHPDKCHVDQATQAFQIVLAAYNKLRR